MICRSSSVSCFGEAALFNASLRTLKFFDGLHSPTESPRWRLCGDGVTHGAWEVPLSCDTRYTLHSTLYTLHPTPHPPSSSFSFSSSSSLECSIFTLVNIRLIHSEYILPEGCKPSNATRSGSAKPRREISVML